MKSMFDLGFRKSFMPLRRALGQDSDIIASYDQGSVSDYAPDIVTQYDLQTPSSTPWEPIPGLVTAQDLQSSSGSSPVPNLVTQQDLERSLQTPTAASSSTDWSKFASDLAKGVGASAAAYAKAQATLDAARGKAGLPLIPLNSAAGSGISPEVLYLVGGLAAVSLLVVLIRA